MSAVFNTITGDDWKRSIAAGRARKNRIAAQVRAVISGRVALCQDGCGLRPLEDLIPCENDPPGLCDMCGGQTCDCATCLTR